MSKCLGVHFGISIEFCMCACVCVCVCMCACMSKCVHVRVHMCELDVCNCVMLKCLLAVQGPVKGLLTGILKGDMRGEGNGLRSVHNTLAELTTISIALGAIHMRVLGEA